MAIRYLLDTNIASYIIKGNSPAVDRHLTKVAIAQLAVSAVTEGELRFGAARLPKATKLRSLIADFFLRVSVLPWDSDAAQKYWRTPRHSGARRPAHGKSRHDDWRSRARARRDPGNQ